MHLRGSGPFEPVSQTHPPLIRLQGLGPPKESQGIWNASEERFNIKWRQTWFTPPLFQKSALNQFQREKKEPTSLNGVPQSYPEVPGGHMILCRRASIARIRFAALRVRWAGVDAL